MKKRRVVVTGMGIISPLGHQLGRVSDALNEGFCPISADESYKKMGFASQITARAFLPEDHSIDRKVKRLMGISNLLPFAFYACEQAIKDARLPPELLSSTQTGIIFGSGGPSAKDQVANAMKTIKNGSPKKLGPFTVYPCMTSGAVALMATYLKIKGPQFMVGSACATSAIAIGEAYQKIAFGLAKTMIAGGTETADWEISEGFDAMGVLARGYNDNPTKASRAFAQDREGFVMTEGAGALVLEEYEQALERGADIYAEVIGYGNTSDGHDYVDPSQDGPVRCMQQALSWANLSPDAVSYINVHGTSTQNGDINEARAIAEVFGSTIPYISSTKSMTGHGLGAAGVHEAIYTLLAMEDGFVPPSINCAGNLDPELPDNVATAIVTEPDNSLFIGIGLSNSFGFGGTNASLLFRSWKDMEVL